MQVFELLPGEYVKTLNGHVVVPILLARESGPYFLVCIETAEKTELERQTKILKLPAWEIFKMIIRYGFNSMETIKQLMGASNGTRSEPN